MQFGRIKITLRVYVLKFYYLKNRRNEMKKRIEDDSISMLLVGANTIFTAVLFFLLIGYFIFWERVDASWFRALLVNITLWFAIYFVINREHGESKWANKIF